MNATGHTHLNEKHALRRAARGLFGSVFVFSVFVNLLMLTGPLFMVQVYDRVLGSRSEETLLALFLLVAALYVLMGVLEYARGRLLARFALRFRNALDARVFRASVCPGVGGAAQMQPAQGLRHLDAVQAFFISPVMLAVFDILWTPFFIAAIFVFHPSLGWLALAGGAALVLAAAANSVLSAPHTSAAQQSSIAAQSIADQTRRLGGIAQSLGMINAMQARWQKVHDDALVQAVRASDWSGSFTAFSKTFRLFLQSAMLALGAWLALQGAVSAGAMIAGSILLGRALAPIEQTLAQWALIQRASAGWRALAQLFRHLPEQGSRLTLPRPVARLSVQGLTVYAEQTRKPLLAGVSFSVESGQTLGVIGNSGAGKSTLAHALVGLARAVGGEIRLGGAGLDQYDPAQLGALIGYLPQEVSLFSGTVAENIARMSLTMDESKVIDAAKRANAHDMILSLPKGYQTRLEGGESGLSGGQKQRLALARALYGDPVLFILDEPNSALDHVGPDALNKAVQDAQRTGCCALIMTHRPQAIAACDQLIVLENGRITAKGARDEVLKSMVQNAGDIVRDISTGKSRAV